MPQTYGKILKQLLSLTETKAAVLANDLDYNLSYISKWCNDVKLPSYKNITAINERASFLFGDAIRKTRHEEVFFETFPNMADQTDIVTAVRKLLDEAYAASSNQPAQTKDADEEVYSKTVIGSYECSAFLSRVFREAFADMDGETDLYIAEDITRLLKGDFFTLLKSCCPEEHHLHVHIGIDLREIERDIALFDSIYHQLNVFLNWDFHFYHMDELMHRNVILMKHHFALQYALDHDYRMDICTCIRDKSVLQNLCDKLTECYAAKSPLMMPEKSLGLDEFGFRNLFYASGRFQFFCTNGFEFLLPDAAFESLIAETQKNHPDPKMIYWVRKIQLSWTELLEKSEIHFMLPVSSVLKYIENGHITFTDIDYNLTIDERKQHAEQILRTMKHNDRIQIFAVKDTGSHSDFSRLSFYSNYSSAFLKKNSQMVSPDTSRFYVIKDRELMALITKYFEYRCQSEASQFYTAEDVAELYETHKTLIHKTMELSAYNQF